MRKQNGLSLLEMLLGLTLLAFAGVLTGQFLSTFLRQNSWVQRQGASEEEALSAYSMIQRVGQFAQSCTADLNSHALQCRIDFNNPPTGNLSCVRFSQSGEDLLYDRDDTGTCSNWKILRRYKNILQFDLCDDASMAPGASSPCAISNEATSLDRLSTRYSESLSSDAIPAGRFFRFRMRSAGASEKSAPLVLQGAFYVRNPAPNNLVYTWESGS